jgi:hypothetical protein
MANLQSKSILQGIMARIMACGALAACITASPVLAQDMIGGKFRLDENARFGSTVVGPGQYKFSIETVGSVQSIQSVQQSAGHLVLVVLRPEKSGPVVSIFAMASPSIHGGEGSELILDPEKTGALADAMYLEKSGLKIDFRWSSPKAKSQVVAQQTVPVQTQSAAVSRSGVN